MSLKLLTPLQRNYLKDNNNVFLRYVCYLAANLLLNSGISGCGSTLTSMADVVDWVSDQLHDLIGLSDRYTAEFLIGLAKKSSTLEAFLIQLEDTASLTLNDPMRDFADQLWRKVPHKTLGEKPARAKEREAILQKQRNKSYQLVLGSDDEDEKVVSRRISISESRKGRRALIRGCTCLFYNRREK